jgi:hypothetical protein
MGRKKNLENYFGLVGGWRVCSVIVAGVKGGIQYANQGKQIGDWGN